MSMRGAISSSLRWRRDKRWPRPASPPWMPPWEPLSLQGSRTPSPLVPPGSSLLPHRLPSSPGKTRPTTQSFASDPKYATPQVIQDPGLQVGPCILPTVHNGRKVSSTHYYLLPEHPPYLELYQYFRQEAQSPEEPASMPVPLMLPPPNTLAPTATVRSMSQAASDPKANFSTNNSNPGAQPPALQATTRQAQRGCPGDGQEAAGPADSIQMVEKLFGLGLQPWMECYKVQEILVWLASGASWLPPSGFLWSLPTKNTDCCQNSGLPLFLPVEQEWGDAPSQDWRTHYCLLFPVDKTGDWEPHLPTSLPHPTLFCTPYSALSVPTKWWEEALWRQDRKLPGRPCVWPASGSRSGLGYWLEYTPDFALED